MFELKNKLINLGVDEDNINNNTLENLDIKLLYSLISILGENNAKNFIEEYYDDINDNEFSMPDNSLQNFIFKNINFRYYPIEKAYVSNGKINLLTVGENKINKEIEGIFKIKDGRKFTNFTMYLVFNNREWFYLDYLKNRIYIASSNKIIEEEINKIDEDDRLLEENDNLAEYSYGLKPLGKLRAEIRKFKFLIKSIKDEDKTD